MVQILAPVERKPSVGQRLSMGVGRGLEMGQQLMQQHKQSQALKQYGIHENLPPELQKVALGEELKGRRDKQNSFEDIQKELDDFNTVKDAWGEKFANVYKAASTGGKTELIKMALDSTLRGDDVNELLKNSGIEEQPSENLENVQDVSPQVEKGKIPKDFQWPDYNKRPFGYTPKTWAEKKTQWRKENAPIYTENANQLNRLDKDILATKALHKLNESKKIPEEGFDRMLINPETGEFYGPAQVLGFKSPEAQLWSKIIAQFQNRAKDAFGSRVTNFDLQSYMQQFPGLLNTKEGRSRILRMMDINYKMDHLYSKALNEIHNHYGLEGIPMEKADELARKMISRETDKLKNEYLDLDGKIEEDSGQVSRKLSGKLLDVKGPDGKTYEVDESEVDQLPEGYRVI